MERIKLLPDRPECVYRPSWDAKVRGYAFNFTRKNLWRIALTHDHEDAMQEAYLVFHRCRKKYTGKVDNAAWFMGLYKVSLSAQINDLSTAASAARNSISMSDLSSDERPYSIEDQPGDLENLGELLTLIRQAPDEVRSLLALLLNAPSEILELATSSWRERGHNNPMASSRRLSQLLGLPESYDVLAATLRHFS